MCPNIYFAFDIMTLKAVIASVGSFVHGMHFHMEPWLQG
jgi:hypothetical protein